MLNSLEIATPRNIRTSLTNKYKRRLFNQQINLRPQTVRLKQTPQDSFSPSHNSFRTIDSAELQLTTEFKKQMNPYIMEKIRNSLSRNSQRRVVRSKDNQFLEDPEIQISTTLHQKKNQRTIDSLNISSPIGHMRISSILNREIKSPFKHKQLISEPIITNTKQKIDRLIQLKKQRDLKYEHLKKSIQQKCSKLREGYINRISSRLKGNTQAKPPVIQSLQWDQQWRNGLKNQSKRYQNRLFSKHIRQNSMKISVLEEL